MAVPVFPGTESAERAEETVVSRDGTRLHRQRYTPPAARATVAVFPGGGDHSGRYPGLTSALVEAGFEVALLDFRGHGRSGGRRWHVRRFADYLDDADAFVATVRKEAAGRPLFLVGHSMGGLIAAAWGLTPGRGLTGVVLSSPYFRLAVKPPAAKVLGARVVGTVIPWLPTKTGLPYADLTSDEEMQRWTEADPLYGKATTPRWFTESARAQVATLERAAEFAYPLLVLTGGADRIADRAGAEAFVASAGSEDRELKEYPRLCHELFNERDRDRVFADVVAWMRARVPVS